MYPADGWDQRVGPVGGDGGWIIQHFYLKHLDNPTSL